MKIKHFILRISQELLNNQDALGYYKAAVVKSNVHAKWRQFQVNWDTGLGCGHSCPPCSPPWPPCWFVLTPRGLPGPGLKAEPSLPTAGLFTGRHVGSQLAGRRLCCSIPQVALCPPGWPWLTPTRSRHPWAKEPSFQVSFHGPAYFTDCMGLSTCC